MQRIQQLVGPRWRDFLIDHRVGISFLAFSALIVVDLMAGYRWHDPKDLSDAYSVSGVLLVVSGLAMRSWAAGVLRKGRSLATTGPYNMCRNPLYLGSVMMMLGFAAFLGDVKNVLVILGPILALYLLTIQREERRLVEKYGSEWIEYAARVPRLLPFRLPKRFAVDWSPSQWYRNHEYRALLTTCLALLALTLWHR